MEDFTISDFRISEDRSTQQLEFAYCGTRFSLSFATSLVAYVQEIRKDEN